MAGAKDIEIRVIPSDIANEFVRKQHYSGKVVPNSTLHFGAFLNGVLHGVMSFGSPMVKRNVLHLVVDKDGNPCKWNNMIELNRMAFDDKLPKNSESRSIAVAIKLLKKNAPHIKWILSFADGTQCGDGTIYRASGFKLTDIKENQSIIKLPNGKVVASITYQKGKYILKNKGNTSVPEGSEVLKGFQLRYIYIIDKNYHLNCEDIPYDRIKEVGADMYKGKKRYASVV